jgi:CheY-like chemotaxis protein
MKYKSVFLIDDDKDDQFLFKIAVAELDPTIQHDGAYDGIEGLNKLKKLQQLPDLIFLDLNMPVMHGFECLKEIKEDPKLRHIPIVIYTTSNSQADKQRARELGASGYCCKPMEYMALCNKLKSILEIGALDVTRTFMVID